MNRILVVDDDVELAAMIVEFLKLEGFETKSVHDGAAVETGSFNFTASAESKNAENVIVLHDQGIAKRYGQEWERLWAESEEMKAQY